MAGKQRMAQGVPAQSGGSEALRLLRLLSAPRAFARRTGQQVAVYVDRGGVTLGSGRVPATALRELLDQGLVAGQGETPVFRLTDAGRSLAPRLLLGEWPGEHAARHMALALRRAGRADDPVLVNEAESPLLWLRRRRDRDGQSLIGAAEFAAGERLRADIERSRMTPRLTADWERPASGGSPGVGLNASEAIVAAKARVDGALSAVGPEFSGLLLDVCGFLKPIERIERERGWPARSAKVVLGLALARLARHYGYANSAVGRAASRVRGWEADGARAEFPAATGR